MGWPQDVLGWLHHLLHISMSLQVVAPQFELSVGYLQSLMMVVALVLAAGFTLLVLLALFLCMIISFAPPVVTPSWLFRCIVVSIAIALVVITSVSLHGTDDMRTGTVELVQSVTELQSILQNVTDRVGALVAPVASYNITVSAAASCLGCFDKNRSALSNFTRGLCGHQSYDLHMSAADAGLAAAGGRAILHLNEFTKLAVAAPRQAAHTAHVIGASATWHSWAAMLPLFALTTTASAIVAGGLFGQKNLLLLAQFVGVVVWWVMCAVVSVEIAMAVGFSDACGVTPRVGSQAVTSVIHAMRDLERGHQEQRRPPEAFFYTNLTTHYLANCTATNPAVEPLGSLYVEALAMHKLLRSLKGGSHAKCIPASMPRLLAQLRESTDYVLAPTAGDLQPARQLAQQDQPEQPGQPGQPGQLQLPPFWRTQPGAPPWQLACGGHGPIAELFRDGAERGLCQGVGIGFVRLFVWQCAGGALLLLISMLLPALWHSHHLPHPSMPTRRAVRAALNPRSPFFVLRCIFCCTPLARAPLALRRRWRARRRVARGPAGGTTALLSDDSAANAPLGLPPAEGDVLAPILHPAIRDGGDEHGGDDGGDDGGGGDGGGATPDSEDGQEGSDVEPLTRASSPELEPAAEHTPSTSLAAAAASSSIEPLLARTEREDTSCSSAHEAL